MNILVTGGASGLGKAITEAVASSENKNSKVYFTYCHSESIAHELEHKFSNVKGIYCDYKSKESLQCLTNQMRSMDLGVLINNAFTGMDIKPFHKMEVDAFSQRFKENISPIVAITKEAICLFRKKRKGKIITVLTSFLVNQPPLGCSMYVAEKAYLASLSKSWATENSKFNITSNCISPGFMETSLNSHMDERVVEGLRESLPHKKFVSINEVAESILFLVRSSEQINGINLLMNAGENIG